MKLLCLRMLNRILPEFLLKATGIQSLYIAAWLNNSEDDYDSDSDDPDSHLVSYI